MSHSRLPAYLSLDRRRFLRAAGFWAAGSVFGPSLMGCGSSDSLAIPCLGAAPPPAEQPGVTYIKASEIGCALDCNLENGRNKIHGGLATDDAAKINEAMAAASANNPITLILDGSALISGLNLPAGGYWSIAGLGCGTGFFIKSGSNSDGIHNGPPKAGNPSDPGPPAPPRGKNVTLTNFTVNGNQGDGHSGDSTSGKRQGPDTGWYCCINLMNLDNITLERLVLVNSPAYHVRFSNVGNVRVVGCVVNTPGLRTDGLHFDGPANDISISSCEFTTGDDAIALNCPEGYSGNITRVTVSNCYFNSWSLMRLETIASYNNPQRFYIDTVSVSNCTGTHGQGAFLIGQAAGSNPNSVTGLTISDCTFTAASVLEVGASFGTVSLNNVTLIPSGKYPETGYAFLRTGSLMWGATYVGTSLSLNNCSIQRNSNATVAGLILEFGSSINNVNFSGFWIGNSGAYHKIPELITVKSGSIGLVVIDGVNSNQISAPTSSGSFATIGTVSGHGVLATGWEFPDLIMADEVPYISASTHKPSIKLGGIVHSYPPS